mgnify:CR=1 FL=1
MARNWAVLVAGAGIKGGTRYGQTDDFCYNIVDRENTGVHVHDLNATIMNQLGFDHERLTYFFQGRHYRLTDVHGSVIQPLLG